MVQRLLRVLLVFTLAVALPTVAVPAAEAQVAALNGVIAATTQKGRIALLDAQRGTRIQQVGQPDDDNSSPQWAPDGNRLAYLYHGHIYIVNSDGSGDSLVPNTNCVGSFSWSPDGTQFAHTDGCNESIRIIDITGDNVQQIYTGDAGAVGWPGAVEWSPAGDWLAISLASDNGSSDIFRIRPDGTSLEQLTNSPTDQAGPLSWSPDGTQIVFTHYDAAGARHVALVNSAGGAITVLTSKRQHASEASWAPSGSKLVFATGDGESSGGLKVMSPNGSNLSTLTQVWYGEPVWQPAGALIRAPRSVVTSGSTVNFQVALAWPDDNPAFDVLRRTSGEPWTKVAEGQTGPDGVATVPQTVRVNGWYKIRWLGDINHASVTSVPTSVHASLKLTSSLHHNYRTRGRWHLYHSEARALLRADLRPGKPRQNVCFIVEWHAPQGRWRSAWKNCYETYDKGTKAGVLFWGWPVGSEGRIRASWQPGAQKPNDHDNLAAQTRWRYFRFTR